MEGCNSVQQSALMVSLQAIIDMQGCETHRITVDSSAEPLVQCVTNMTRQMENVLSGNVTGKTTDYKILNIKYYMTCLPFKYSNNIFFAIYFTYIYIL